jgi:hypothetical protein
MITLGAAVYIETSSFNPGGSYPKHLDVRNSEPMCLGAGWLHPTLNVENPEDAIDMSVIVGNEKQKMDVNVALSNSFGFGGHNSSILFRAYNG